MTSKAVLLIIFLLLCLCGLGAYAFAVWSVWWPIALCALALCGSGAVLALYFRQRGQLRQLAEEAVQQKFLAAMDFPVALIQPGGGILWSNGAFDALGGTKKIDSLLPGLDPAAPEAVQQITRGEREYLVRSEIIHLKAESAEHKICLQYWQDNTDERAFRKKYEDTVPAICLIQVDNYEEMSEAREVRDSGAIAEVERSVIGFVRELGGVIRRYDSGRWIVVLNRAGLQAATARRFALLDSVRDIESGSRRLTLSIGVGVSEQLDESSRFAALALELAMGRGGDQAVVKEGNAHAFYGGKRQSVERHSKVKSRVFANALYNLIKQAERVIIMGHRQSDMDSMGAAVGLACCCRKLNKKNYIIVEPSNIMVSEFLQEFNTREEYKGVAITPEEAKGLAWEDTLLIVVDTHRKSAMAVPELYDMCQLRVVIDHHRRSTDAVADTTLSFLDPTSSSACELVTEVIEYFAPDMHPTPFECAALLAGITIDTKGFAFNAGVRTFEAASYLRRYGADATFVKQLFQDDLETYVNRSKVVTNAEVIVPGIAIATCPQDLPNQPLLAAQAADALNTIRGVRAAFVLGYLNDGITVSGRSIGDINVQVVLEKIGGGGHLNVSGAQLKGISMQEARSRVIKAIHEYVDESADTAEH